MSDRFHVLRVGAAHDETRELRALFLDGAEPVLASYRVPGQYVRVRLPGSPEGVFAVASAPGRRPLELLVKRSPGVADRLAALSPGDTLEVAEAEGKGFPVDRCRGRDVLLFATGSGIAPIRAVLQVVAADRAAFGAVDLFYGVRTRADYAYDRELDALAAASVRVHRIVSRRVQPDEPHVGYVQQRFERELPDVTHAEALLCGRAEMIEAVRRTLVRAGLPPDRIHLNL